MNDGYFVGNTGHFVKELGLTKHETQTLKNIGRDYLQSDGGQRFRGKLRAWNHQISDLKSYYDLFESEKGYAEEFNESMFRKIDAALDSNAKKTRFRQVLTQLMLRSGKFDCLVRMHGLRLDYDDFEKLQQRLQAIRRSGASSMELHQYYASMSLLGKQIAPEQLALAAGDVYSGSLGGRPDVLPRAAGEFDIRITLIAKPKIQAELNVTVRQAKKLVGLHSGLKPKQKSSLKSILPEEFGGEPAPKIDLSASLETILDDQQRTRLDQLAFQYYIRKRKPDAAFAQAGLELKNRDPLFARWVQTEAWYASQIDSFNLYYPVFETLVGVPKCRHLCGKVSIAYSIWRHHDVERDEKILQSVLSESELITSKRSKNVRRHSAQ